LRREPSVLGVAFIIISYRVETLVTCQGFENPAFCAIA